MNSSPFLQNIRQFKLKSLYFNYLWSYLLIILLSFSGLFALFSYYLVSDFNNQIEATAHTTAQKDTDYLSAKIQVLRNAYNALTADTNISRFMNHKGKLFHSDINITRNISYTINTIKQQQTYNSDIQDIIVYNAHSDYMLTTVNGKHSSECQDALWYPLLWENMAEIHLLCDNTTLYLGQSLTGGTMIIEMNNPFPSLAQEKDLYIFSKLTDTLIYSSKDLADPPAFSDLPALEGIVGSSLFIRHEDSWLTYVYEFPVYSIFDNNSLFFTIFMMAILLIILMICLSFYQTHQSYRHIANILSALRTPNSDATNGFARNELQFIYNNLIHSMNSRKMIEAQLMDNVEQLKKSQNIALQTQISPHYLFNILNMINISIQNTVKGDCPGTKMITLLSQHLRYTLNTRNNLITLEEELDHIRYYVELQKFMHEDLLQVHYEIDESCLDILCPRLILQPLIENSIQHGMRDGELLTITLRICCMKKTVQIIVIDDGKGIPPDRLAALQGIPRSLPENEHIGLMNVIKRLHLMYDQHFSYDIQSVENKGTAITFQFLLD